MHMHTAPDATDINKCQPHPKPSQSQWRRTPEWLALAANRRGCDGARQLAVGSTPERAEPNAQCCRLVRFAGRNGGDWQG